MNLVSETIFKLPAKYLIDREECRFPGHYAYCNRSDPQSLAALYNVDIEGTLGLYCVSRCLIDTNFLYRMRSKAEEWRIEQNKCAAIFFHLKNEIFAMLKQWGDHVLLFLRDVVFTEESEEENAKFFTAGQFANLHLEKDFSYSNMQEVLQPHPNGHFAFLDIERLTPNPLICPAQRSLGKGGRYDFRTIASFYSGLSLDPALRREYFEREEGKFWRDILSIRRVVMEEVLNDMSTI